LDGRHFRHSGQRAEPDNCHRQTKPSAFDFHADTMGEISGEGNEKFSQTATTTL
jgi:hypothetical protein